MRALQDQPASEGLPAIRRVPLALAAALAVAATLLITATVLWAHYGTTVFFELIAAGIAACF